MLQLPDWEVLPYDQFSPLPDLVSERLATLARLPALQKRHAAGQRRNTAAATAAHRLHRRAAASTSRVGAAFSMAPVSEQLARAGYSMVAQVGAPGEFALRGSLFDVFPMGYAQPLRIDLFDETIDSIRHFDPDTQRSLDQA